MTKFKCRFNPKAYCISNGLCEYCKIPKSQGWIYAEKRGKPTFIQVFITERDRQARIAYLRKQIDQAFKNIEKLWAMDSKSTYEERVK